MNLRSFRRLALLTIALQLLIAAWGLSVTGLAGEVPIHWGANGEVNGYGPAWVGFLLTPAISIGLALLFLAIPRIEPRRVNLEKSASAYRTLANTMLVLLLGLQLVLVLAGTGHDVPVSILIGAGLGVLFVVLGNVLTTVRSNFMFGIRTPWTLTSDLAWDKTHRLVGRLFVIGGLLTFLASLTQRTELTLIVLLGFTLGSVGVGFVYSYQVWKSDPDRRSLGGDQA